ncbi:MAG: hypothetical protein HZB14_01840 [Actinobacteria bacterium]|nr:hypothetical protein [Actinomycetota bacterium]
MATFRTIARGPGIVAATLVIVASALLAGCGESKQESAALAELEPKTAQFAAAKGKPSTGGGHIRGRLVTIDVDADEIDRDVYNELIPALQARAPKEVETVVLIDYREEVVGEYGDGAKAKQSVAGLTIVDLKSDKQFSGEVDGPDPPQNKVGGGDKSGGDVYAFKIADYLEGLPRK